MAKKRVYLDFAGSFPAVQASAVEVLHGYYRAKYRFAAEARLSMILIADSRAYILEGGDCIEKCGRWACLLVA